MILHGGIKLEVTAAHCTDSGLNTGGQRASVRNAAASIGESCHAENERASLCPIRVCRHSLPDALDGALIGQRLANSLSGCLGVDFGVGSTSIAHVRLPELPAGFLFPGYEPTPFLCASNF